MPDIPSTGRPLRAVLVSRHDPGRLAERLAAALDGTGPAIFPVDAGLPRARIEAMLGAFRPAEVEDQGGSITRRYDPGRVPDDTAVLIGTSGSTGDPKGVCLPATALLSSARASLARIGARAGERWLLCLPSSHVSGLGILVRSLVAGTGPVLAERADPATLATTEAAHVSLVPTQLRRLAPDFTVLRRFTSVLLGGAPAEPELLAAARAAGAPVRTTYGMTESCGGCVYDGLPLDGVRVRIDPDERICLAGPVLFSGYLGQPRRTGGWYRTSDLGRLSADGVLTVRGRADDVINTGGHKVLPSEVTAVLRGVPGIKDVAIIGQSSPEWGEQVVAVVVPADPAEPPALKTLGDRVSGKLPRYAIPRRVVLTDAIPVLPNGKPDLARLRRDLAAPDSSC